MRSPDDADVFNALRRLSKGPRTQYYKYVETFTRMLSRVLTPAEKSYLVECVIEGNVPRRTALEAAR